MVGFHEKTDFFFYHLSFRNCWWHTTVTLYLCAADELVRTRDWREKMVRSKMHDWWIVMIFDITLFSIVLHLVHEFYSSFVHFDCTFCTRSTTFRQLVDVVLTIMMMLLLLLLHINIINLQRNIWHSSMRSTWSVANDFLCAVWVTCSSSNAPMHRETSLFGWYEMWGYVTVTQKHTFQAKS